MTQPALTQLTNDVLGAVKHGRHIRGGEVSPPAPPRIRRQQNPVRHVQRRWRRHVRTQPSGRVRAVAARRNAPVGRQALADYIVKKGRQLHLTPTEVRMALAVAKHESNWNPVGFMGFGPEAKAAGYNFDNNSYGAVDQFFKQYVDRIGACGNRNDPNAVANYVWHTVHNAADPNYGPKLLNAYRQVSV